MKKFLTMLLALSVVFTYTFGAAGSVFAATYSLEDYSNALQNEKTAQIGYMGSAKTQALGAVSFDANGFDTNKYSKVAYEAAADAVINTLSDKVDTNIRTYLDSLSFPMAAAADLSEVRDVTTDATIGAASNKDATTAAGMTDLLKVVTNTAGDKVLDATQAPLTKKFVEDKLAAVDLSKYNSTDKAYAGNTLTAAQYVQSLIDTVNTAIANEEADSTKGADDKVVDYYNLYFAAGTGFKAKLAAVPTLEDEAAADAEAAKSVEGAAKAFVSYGLDTAKKVYPMEAVVAGTDLYDLTSKVVVDPSVAGTGAYKAFYDAAAGSKKATVFGVEVGNIAKVTKAELTAINAALYNAIVASEAVLKNSGLTAAEITARYADNATYLTTLNNTANVAEKYSDVEKYATSLKGAYTNGLKTYDDAKVDAALTAAKKIVYTDIKANSLDDADVYLAKAIAANEGVGYTSVSASLALIEIANFDADKFADAKEDAIKKMYKSLSPKAPQTKVLYGDNKTAEADYVYLKETYFTATTLGGSYDTVATKTASDWGDIADDAVDAINAAQNYADIEAALAEAKAEFSKLILAVDGKDVVDARTTYCTALGNYKTTAWGLADTTKYSEATFDAAVTAGQKLINKAITVDAVKAAYEEAKKVVDAAKSNAELAAAKAEIERKINSLPATSSLTAADLATVKAVVDAYAEYKAIPGVAAVTTTVLKSKYEKTIELVEAEIALDAKALYKKMSAVSTDSDADVAAYVAMKSDAEAIKARGTALLDEIEAVNDDAVFATNVAGGTSLDNGNRLIDTDYEEIVDALDVTSFGGFHFKEVTLVNSKLVKAGQANATEAEMKAALDAYNKLTDAQKYLLTRSALSVVTVIENKLAELEEAAKWTDKDVKAAMYDAAKTTSYTKPSKTSVKLTAKADMTEIKENGYTVKYRFYQKGPKKASYKLWKTSTSGAYTFKGLKKGTHSFKVKVSVYNAEGKLVAYKYTNVRTLKIK